MQRFLGEWTDEIGGGTDSDFATLFLVSGAKSYFYTTMKGKLVNKFKGIP